MKLQYVTNEDGLKTAVLLSVSDYEQLLDELDELKAIKAFDKVKAKNEPTIPLRDAIKLRKKKRAKI
jgi:PHD/YefM family antitoxin component YafN of YafNO toxin-antitoxin module